MESVWRTEGKIRQVRRVTDLRSTALGRRQPQILGEREQSIKLINSINKWMGKEDVAHIHNGIFSSVQSLSRVRLLATPWIAARQASLNITNSWSLLTHVHRVSDAIQPSHLLSSPSPPAPNPSQHLSHKKNETVLFSEMWTDSETITQENQKNKYRILTHIYGI